MKRQTRRFIAYPLLFLMWMCFAKGSHASIIEAQYSYTAWFDYLLLIVSVRYAIQSGIRFEKTIR